MLSAVSMAWRTISSASTRSTTEPAFMPLAAVWAKPRMRTPWLRRRSTSCGATGSSRAIRQTILLVPMSSAATTAERRGDTGFILGVRPKRSTVTPRVPQVPRSARLRTLVPFTGEGQGGGMRRAQECAAAPSLTLPCKRGRELRCARGERRARKRARSSHASPPLPLLLGLLGRLERVRARGGGGIRQPHGDAVGQPQIDGDDVARQNLLARGRARPKSASALLGLDLPAAAPRRRPSDAEFQRRSATSTEASTLRAISG